MSNHGKAFKQSVVEFYCAAITVTGVLAQSSDLLFERRARGLPVFQRGHFLEFVLYDLHRSEETASNSLASDVKRLCTLLGRSTRGLAYSIAAVG